MRFMLCCMAVFAAGLTGCDYTEQLVKTPDLPIDRALIGSWTRTDENDRPQRLLVLPLGPNEYLVSFPAGEQDSLYARACHCKAGDLALVQLTWFGTGRGDTADDNRVYQYAVYTVKGDTLQIGLLNADIVSRTVATPDALLKAIAEKRESPDLFREAMTFKKEPPREAAGARLKRPPVPAAW